MKQGAPGMVLLVDGNAVRRDQMAFAMASRCDFQVQPAATLAEARSFLKHPHLIGIACDEGADGESGDVLLQEVRASIGIDRVAFVLMSASANTTSRIRGWAHDADAVVNHPVHPAELQACLHACLGRRALQAELAVEFSRRGEDANRTQELLLSGLEAVAPGARLRGEQLVALGTKVAIELHVPEELLPDLARAGRLHEIGRFVVTGEGHHGSPPILAASAALLQPLPGLANTAELVAGMGANWDGSGPLTHLERGSIPLRSRILRAVADYYIVLDQRGTADQACELLALHSGTYYDPAVLAELALVVSGSLGEISALAIEPLRVEQLTEGRMLVNDLCTASGVKLLSAGSVLTPASLRLIAERHALDPIVHAIATRKQVA